RDEVDLCVVGGASVRGNEGGAMRLLPRARVRRGRESTGLPERDADTRSQSGRSEGGQSLQRVTPCDCVPHGRTSSLWVRSAVRLSCGLGGVDERGPIFLQREQI